MIELFLSVLNMSLTGAFVVAVICLARLPLKKAPKIISYCLWAVAGFRLLFPFSVESVFSLMPIKPQPIPPDIAMQAIPRIDSGIPYVNNAVSSILPAPGDFSTVSVNPLQVWTAIGASVWVLGIAAMLLYSVVSIILLKRGLRSAVHLRENICESADLKTPLVIGLFRPKIYIPTGLSDSELRYILLHEQTHIRRRDHIVKMFAYFVLCLHWFNPLTWVAFLLMGADMEMSCDERVVKELGGDIVGDYSMSLVRIAAGRRILNGSPLAFGEGGMKERIKRMLNFKKPSQVIVIAAVVLVAALSVGFAVNKAAIKDDVIDNNINDGISDDVSDGVSDGLSEYINDDISDDISEYRLLTNLGYTKELLAGILDKRKAFSSDIDSATIGMIVSSLPLPAYRDYHSFMLQTEPQNGIIINYEFGDHYNLDGNGLDPFYDTVEENNALILFAAVEGLEEVSFVSYENFDDKELNRADRFTLRNLRARFGTDATLSPRNMGISDLYASLGTNIWLSEWYFAHLSRIYLGADTESVLYRNDEPDEIRQQPDGATVWIYSNLGRIYRTTPSGESEIANPGYTAMYYFRSLQDEASDNLAGSGLYATRFIHADNYGKTYGEITNMFGNPTVIKTNGDGDNTYIAYTLREGQQRHAYFVLHNDIVIEEGVMYGIDYSALS